MKQLKVADHIESAMTERILRCSLATLESFNQVRNTQSFAHDNPILNYDESLLIFNHVTSLVRFEIDSRQLGIRKARAPAQFADKLVCCLGEFPERVAFPEASFDGVYTARLLHFFDGERIQVSLNKLHGWLRPGGKVFLVSDAIYRTIFKASISTYESRVAAGDAWPGIIQDIRSRIPQDLHPENFPDTMNSSTRPC